MIERQWQLRCAIGESNRTQQRQWPGPSSAKANRGSAGAFSNGVGPCSKDAKATNTAQLHQPTPNIEMNDQATGLASIAPDK
jgi:hypothetical protein